MQVYMNVYVYFIVLHCQLMLSICFYAEYQISQNYIDFMKWIPMKYLGWSQNSKINLFLIKMFLEFLDII